MTPPTSVSRHFTDPTNGEPIEVPYGYRLVRIANHPETGKMIVLPRDQVRATVTVLVNEADTSNTSDSTEVITTEIELRSHLVMVKEPMEQPFTISAAA